MTFRNIVPQWQNQPWVMTSINTCTTDLKTSNRIVTIGIYILSFLIKTSSDTYYCCLFLFEYCIFIVSDDEVGIFYKNKSYILGQWWVLQFCVDDAAPEHWAPPCCGDGFVQDLNFCCVPPPQVTVHVFHDDHEVYPPSTEIDRLSLEKHHIID